MVVSIRHWPLNAAKAFGFKKENAMTTNIVIEKAGEVVEAIRSAATSVLEAIEDDRTELRDGLASLRETLAEARQIGIPEADIEKTLEDVRQSYPDRAETWPEILEQLVISVWLENPDGERLRGDTEIVDRIIWENWDDDEILEEVVQQLRDDLEANWEVVGVAETPSDMRPPISPVIPEVNSVVAKSEQEEVAQ
jgi:hypothetical protein